MALHVGVARYAGAPRRTEDAHKHRRLSVGLLALTPLRTGVLASGRVQRIIGDIGLYWIFKTSKSDMWRTAIDVGQERRQRTTSNRNMRGRLRRLACLGVVGVFITNIAYAVQTPTSSGRLSLRPHEIATGTRNATAGVYVLDSLPDYLVYVCMHCAGTRRMPLVVVLHGGGGSSREQLDWMREFADRHGMIMLLPNSPNGHWALRDPAEVSNEIDIAMRQVLRQYAIDPDRIAVLGMSEGGGLALSLGRNNLDVFSRVAPLWPNAYSETGPQSDKSEFFLAAGLLEEGEFYETPVRVARELRQAGTQVKQVLMLRPHQQRQEDYEYVWNWLHESWAEPNPMARSSPRTTADLTTELTLDAVTKMASFWTRLSQGPDSIRTTARSANLREYAVHIGQDQVAGRMMDMPAIATEYPTVAADLQRAGLTAAQEQAYRAALISAKATVQAGGLAAVVEPASILGKNVEFVNTNADTLRALDESGMWEAR